MTESDGEAVREKRAMVRWFSLETGRPVYSDALSEKDAMAVFHHDQKEHGITSYSKASVIREGTEEFRVNVAEFNRKWKEEWRKTLQPTPWAIRLD